MPAASACGHLLIQSMANAHSAVTLFKMNHAILRLIFLVVLCASITVVFTLFPSLSDFNEQWIDTHFRSAGKAPALYFIFVATCLLTCALPRQVVALMAGYAFGVVEGAVYSTLAATISCSVCFFSARFLTQNTVNKLFAGKVKKVNPFLAEQVFLKAFTLRILPLGSNYIINLVAGVTSVKPAPFIGGSAAGYIPQMVLFALMGNGLEVQSGWQIAFSAAMLAVSIITGYYIYRTFRLQHATKR